MPHRYALLIALTLASTSAWTQQAPEPEAATVPSILVVGQRPGPALWKVSKDDHVLWIFASYGPLPTQMDWRSQQLETVLANSQELLGTPGTVISVGWSNSLNMLTALPFLAGVKKNVDGARLQDQVPPDVYARWTVLKQKYIGNDAGIEELRPMFAAQTLSSRALGVAGMDGGGAVTKRIYELGKNWKIPITSTSVNIPLENPRETLRDFKKSKLDDVACFTQTIDRLEKDLETMRRRANAWAMGDLPTLRKLDFPDEKIACNAAVVDSKWLNNVKGAADMRKQVKATWIAAAEKSLTNNRSTLAVLAMSELTSPDGMLAVLRARGYQIEEPE
ncbi:TraB/GumN family protein [Massilia sp. S19_KUP03_FR1]|uniref:TraB/GumN family protein n=1 Tax=Massilia sp. S19_KUP03_FR1 TaxID=3025503 RepID=UPI002FCDDE48